MPMITVQPLDFDTGDEKRVALLNLRFN